MKKKVHFKKKTVETDEKIDVPQEPPILERQQTREPQTPPPSPKKKVRKPNAWVSHVRKIATEKNISYKEAMSIAKDTYTKN